MVVGVPIYTGRYQQCCYLCNQLGHITNKGKGEYKDSGQKGTSVNSQVITKPTEDNSADITHLSDPQTFLFSDSDSSVDTVRVDDKGSKPQYLSVQVQGVPTSGIIDTGTDITISCLRRWRQQQG